MNYGPVVFLAAFFALATSWFGFVLTPQIQIGRMEQQTNVVNKAEMYPPAPPGLARRGLQVYRANNCAACHTEQVDQTGTVCDVLLTDAGTNHAAVVKALVKLGVDKAEAGEFLSGLPKTVREGVTKYQADAAVKALKAAEAKAQVNYVAVGPDMARGWGTRRSVAADYLYTDPVMLGSLRVGPDLANVGVRKPDANWQLRHLYAPSLPVKGSPMPSYRFLFKEQKIEWRPSPDALQLPKELAPPPGYEIVPRPEATALVAYLLSLRAETPLFEVPLGALSAAPTTGTNAPAK